MRTVIYVLGILILLASGTCVSLFTVPTLLQLATKGSLPNDQYGITMLAWMIGGPCLLLGFIMVKFGKKSGPKDK